MYQYIIENARAIITRWDGKMPARMEIPQQVDGYPVYALGDWAFANQTELVDLVLPEGLEVVGWYAFSGCSKLNKLTLPQSLVELGGSVFKECTALKDLHLPSGLSRLGPHFSEGCLRLEKIQVHEDNENFMAVEGIVYSKDGKELIGAPPGWKGRFHTPPGLEKIRGEAFWGCSTLEEVHLGLGVKIVGNHGFYGCPIKKLVLSPDLTEIGEWAFGRGKQLQELQLPTERELPEHLLKELKRSLEGRNLRSFEGTARSMDLLLDERQKGDLLFAYIVGELQLSHEAAKVYDHKVKEYQDVLFRKIMAQDAASGLYVMDRLGLIHTGNQSVLQDEAARRQSSHVMLYLLEHQNRNRSGEESWEVFDDPWNLDF